MLTPNDFLDLFIIRSLHGRSLFWQSYGPSISQYSCGPFTGSLMGEMWSLNCGPSIKAPTRWSWRVLISKQNGSHWKGRRRKEKWQTKMSRPVQSNYIHSRDQELDCYYFFSLFWEAKEQQGRRVRCPTCTRPWNENGPSMLIHWKINWDRGVICRRIGLDWIEYKLSLFMRALPH